MSNPEASIRVKVDPTNPGQFFACCGLLELADRLWPGAEGWFEGKEFCIASGGTLETLIHNLVGAEFLQLDPEDSTSTPIEIGTPFKRLLVDWWLDTRSGGRDLKVWAGTMESFRIATAMRLAMNDSRFHTSELFNISVVAFDPQDMDKKVEPYYFDARRGLNAHSRDVGFSPNDLSMTTTAFPAVELLCLIGLQRCLPARTKQSRVFEYSTWSRPFAPELLPSIVTGVIRNLATCTYQFENSYRTGQKKHKAFLPATLVSSKGDL